MQTPKLIDKPFAASGLRNSIPHTRDNVVEQNAASYTSGFPISTMTPVELGGLPPSGKDMNGILYELSHHIAYQNRGLRYRFDRDYAQQIDGYPRGAVLVSDDGMTEYISEVDNNKTDPNNPNLSIGWGLFSGKKLLDSLKNQIERNINPVNNLMELRLLSSTSPIVYLKSVTDLPQGMGVGGGLFYADNADKTTTDNGATVIVSQDGTRWKRIHDELRPEYFGAVGNGVADDTQPLMKTIEVAKAAKLKIVGKNHYFIREDLNFRAIAVDFHQSKILLSDGAKVYIGGNARHSSNPNQAFGEIVSGSIKFDPAQYTSPSIVCIGAKGQHISIRYTDFILFWQSTNPATYPSDASQAYNTFNINFVIKIKVDCDERYHSGSTNDGAGSSVQWFNENMLHLNRCYGFEMTGNYRHNCNLIVGGSFETDKSYIRIEYGNKNKFVNARLEGVGYVYFGENTEANILERTYFGSVSGLPIPRLTDMGVFNRIETEVLDKSKAVRVFEINPFMRRFNGFADENRFRQVSRIIRPSVNYGFIANSDKIKLQGKKDILLFDFDGVSSRYAIEISVFNEKGVRLNANQVAFSSGFALPQASGLFAGSPYSNEYYGQHRFMIMQDGVYYVSCRISASRDYKECKSHRFEIDFYGKKPSRDIGLLPVVPANAPTQYIGFQGDVIEYKGGKVLVEVHIQTTATAKSGSTITLASGALGRDTLKAGDAVGIESPTGAIQWTTLESAEGEVLTLAEPLADWVAIGDSVYISRLTQIADYTKAAA